MPSVESTPISTRTSSTPRNLPDQSCPQWSSSGVLNTLFPHRLRTRSLPQVEETQTSFQGPAPVEEEQNLH
eukprot:3935070-Rhodomonas_salina.1